MQPILNAARELPVFLGEIFRISYDRMSDVSHMCAQLVSSAGDRLERKPCQLTRGGIHHRVIGYGVASPFLAMARNAHDRIVLALFFCEESGNAPLARLGNARHERPIDFSG